jgi:hypothetical protein
MHLPFDELILMNWGTGSSGISVLWDTWSGSVNNFVAFCVNFNPTNKP